MSILNKKRLKEIIELNRLMGVILNNKNNKKIDKY